ncbi:ester cyclase [Flagellimonas zhangzhouensis]|uniref:SnoaL-like polyketide cyclase n=1 Tax=Flagellimonas zhangzhouensis TaxID=1073328 RepID=A0A1H2RS94_9FLAO|nr:ester cyclase [Allomuricauda zhangzhouensis]SDQ66529.1 SnoaL-like polyketide cyclase [Allomuricauda zhangzhouensis]SDW21509.1 SnoaL-like polyketide cyclase [Allomuricauda zhangzhouensis]
MKSTIKLFFASAVIAISLIGCNNQDAAKEKEIVDLKAQLAQIAQENATIAENLKTFDELDFEVYSNQDWKRLHESHSDDILVHYPDGHTSKGIEDHIKELDPMFVFAPDTRIEVHPIKIGSGNITAVVGELIGTFSEPMPIGNGQFIQPTGKSFKLPMSTIGLWNEDGVMYEEYLFYDNQAFMKQIGLAN